VCHGSEALAGETEAIAERQSGRSILNARFARLAESALKKPLEKEE
jgi:hypothetical protein